MLGYFASASFPYLHCDKSWLLAAKYLIGFTVLRAHLTAGLGHPGFVSLAVRDKWFKREVTNGQSQHTAGFISREGLGWSPKDFRAWHPLSQRIPAASNFFPGATRARVTCRSPLSVRLRTSAALRDGCRCCLATASEPHVVLAIAHGVRGSCWRGGRRAHGRCLRWLTFSSAAGARQMKRGAGEPALLEGRCAGAGRELGFLAAERNRTDESQAAFCSFSNCSWREGMRSVLRWAVPWGNWKRDERSRRHRPGGGLGTVWGQCFVFGCTRAGDSVSQVMS